MLRALVLSASALWSLSNACSFTASNDNGKKLDLSGVDGDRIYLGRDTDDFNYYWTPCTDNIVCTGNSGTSNAMIAQVNDQDNSNNGKCNVVSKWSESVSPSYDSGSKTWSFDYTNGDDCNGSPRVGRIDIVCGSTNNYTSSWSLSEPAQCEYDFSVQLKVACGSSSSGGGGGGNDDDLSGGWIIIIILLVGFVLYFAVGCVFTKVRQNNEGEWTEFKKNTPCAGFWCNFHLYVKEGCVVTKRFIDEKSGRGSGHEQLVDETDE